MAGEEWDKHPDGNIVVQPVLGYAVATLPKAALLRVLFAATQADFEARKPSAVQLAMAPELARTMARTLNQIADAIEPPPLAVLAPAPVAAQGSSAAVAPLPVAQDDYHYSIGDGPEELTFDYRG